MMRHAHRYQLVNLLRIGGWISLSSAIGPIIVYTDRFVIGFLLGGAAVSAYSVPFDLLSRFPLLIVSASYVLLPTLVNLSVSAVQDKRAAMSLWDTLRYATLAAVAFSASGVALGWLLLPYFLSWWVGPELSSLGVGPGQYLLVAFAVNAVTQIPLTCLYAMRETRVVAIIHLLEVGPYLLLLVWSVERYGVTGAAVACLCRAVADFVLLGVACHRKVNAHAAEQSV
jgi:O-antigen/teichoic acid export membrane protein